MRSEAKQMINKRQKFFYEFCDRWAWFFNIVIQRYRFFKMTNYLFFFCLQGLRWGLNTDKKSKMFISERYDGLIFRNEALFHKRRFWRARVKVKGLIYIPAPRFMTKSFFAGEKVLFAKRSTERFLSRSQVQKQLISMLAWRCTDLKRPLLLDMKQQL